MKKGTRKGYRSLLDALTPPRRGEKRGGQTKPVSSSFKRGKKNDA